MHDTVKQGLISPYVQMAREKGIVAYIDQEANRWAACHVNDVARLYILALDRAESGARYHAVAEEGVAARNIAEVVAKGLGVPATSVPKEQAEGHFGWFAMFASADIIASSTQTRQKLAWAPNGLRLLDDLRNTDYSAI